VLNECPPTLKYSARPLKKLCSVLIDQVVLEILIVKVCFQLNVIEITLKTSVHKNSKLSMWSHGKVRGPNLGHISGFCCWS